MSTSLIVDHDELLENRMGDSIVMNHQVIIDDYL